MTAATVVCCSMISLIQTRYGSGVSPGRARQGRRLRWRSYQPSSRAAEGMADTKRDMQGAGEPGKQHAPPADVRHIYGPRPVGALVPRLVRAAFRKRSPATAQVIADWEAIVGPMLAEVTTPRRLAAGTLTL